MIAFDPTVNENSSNQVRGVGVGRSGANVVLRWAHHIPNSKKLKLYFQRPGDAGTVDLTPEGLSSGTEGFVIPEQALADVNGTFYVTQVNANGTETGPSVGFEMPSTSSSIIIGPDDPPCCGDPGGGGGTSPIVFANAFHHRDHLGSLRVVTDSAGQKVSGHDYYPFGTEMFPAGVGDDGTGSRKRFTGHERDATTGMDYMLARYYPTAMARFTTVDPSNGSIKPAQPQTWNRFTYGLDNPVNRLDPDGRADSPAVAFRQTAGMKPKRFSKGDLRSIDRANAKGAVGGALAFGAIYFAPQVAAWSTTLFLNPQVQIGTMNAVAGFTENGAASHSAGAGRASGQVAEELAEMSGMLRAAARGSGNFGIGEATRAQALAMGEAWVGPGSRPFSNGRGILSVDGLRQFRFPALKPALGQVQANFESRPTLANSWVSNAHLDILD